MSKNAMAGAVTLCGVGLCMIGGAMLMQNGAQAHAAAGSMPAAAAAAVAATANAQAGGEPTVVWYSVTPIIYEHTGPEGFERFNVYRAWSDGTVEYRTVRRKTQSFGYGGQGWYLNGAYYCENAGQCTSPWIQCATPAEGFKAAADMNADEIVDGADLATVLSNWGDAPRVPFPPSDCPLNLINP